MPRDHLLVWKILKSFVLIKHRSYLSMWIASYKHVVDNELDLMESFQLEQKQYWVETKQDSASFFCVSGYRNRFSKGLGKETSSASHGWEAKHYFWISLNPNNTLGGDTLGNAFNSSQGRESQKCKSCKHL